MKPALLIAATMLTVGSVAHAGDRYADIRAMMDAVIQEAIDAGEVPNSPAFDPSRSADADVDAALSAAQASGKHVLLVMGGSWCHDSMALWDAFHSDRFVPMLAERYELVWVDVGHRDRNLDIARRFGLPGLEGTPTVLILTPDGTATNLDDAPSWRNAASRKVEAIYRHFSRAVVPPAAP